MRLSDRLRGTKELKWYGKPNAVFEQGHRVHSVQLMQDVFVKSGHNFEGYWDWAQRDGRLRRGPR